MATHIEKHFWGYESPRQLLVDLSRPEQPYVHRWITHEGQQYIARLCYNETGRPIGTVWMPTQIGGPHSTITFMDASPGVWGRVGSDPQLASVDFGSLPVGGERSRRVNAAYQERSNLAVQILKLAGWKIKQDTGIYGKFTMVV